MQIGLAKSPTERAFIFQADGACNAARSFWISSFGADGNPTTATLCFHYCHLMIQISTRKSVKERKFGCAGLAVYAWDIFRYHCPKRSGFANFSCFQINSRRRSIPCVGDGGAFEVITSGAHVLRYGIELDAYRAEQARERIANVLQANTLEVQCPVESYSLGIHQPPL